MENLKINISKEATTKLNKLINANPTYDCIKIDYEPQCGNNPINLYLDKFKSEYIIDQVDNVFFMYKDSITLFISCIDIIYENSDFMVKAIPANNDKKAGCCCCKTSNCHNNSTDKQCSCSNSSCSNKSKCKNCPHSSL